MWSGVEESVVTCGVPTYLHYLSACIMVTASFFVVEKRRAFPVRLYFACTASCR